MTPRFYIIRDKKTGKMDVIKSDAPYPPFFVTHNTTEPKKDKDGKEKKRKPS